MTKDILLDRLYDTCFGDCQNNVSREVFKERYSPLSNNELVKPLIVLEKTENPTLSIRQLSIKFHCGTGVVRCALKKSRANISAGII